MTPEEIQHKLDEMDRIEAEAKKKSIREEVEAMGGGN